MVDQKMLLNKKKASEEKSLEKGNCIKWRKVTKKCHIFNKLGFRGFLFYLSPCFTYFLFFSILFCRVSNKGNSLQCLERSLYYHSLPSVNPTTTHYPV